MQQGTDPPSSEGVDAIQGQQAAFNNHRETTGVHSCSSTSIWLYYGSHTGVHSCSSTTISEGGMWGHTSSCTIKPTQVFPPGRLLRCRRRIGRLPTSGAAQTSLPEGMFRIIRRKEYRLGVGTHYGPTRIHQAAYSPSHQRHDIAGTTIQYSIISTSTAGPNHCQ
jgi:hypothetical protein